MNSDQLEFLAEHYTAVPAYAYQGESRALKSSGDLSLAYQNVINTFAVIFKLVGYELSPEGTHISNDIVLGKLGNKALTTEVRLEAPTLKAPDNPTYSEVTSIFSVKDEDDTTSEIARESFSPIAEGDPESYLLRHAVILNDYSGAKLRRLVPDTRKRITVLNTAWGSVGMRIFSAKTTQTLIGSAIKDPSLNPDYAAKLMPKKSRKS